MTVHVPNFGAIVGDCRACGAKDAVVWLVHNTWACDSCIATARARALLQIKVPITEPGACALGKTNAS